MQLVVNNALFGAVGYEQRGAAAVAADNVFHPLTYGDIDIDAIEDPVMRAAAREQVASFGQCPRRLFRSPHPQRFMSMLPRSLFDTPHLLKVIFLTFLLSMNAR